MATSPLRNRFCLYCDSPIWYNTFLMEWFHSSPYAEPHPETGGPTPAPIKRTRSPKE